MMPLTLAEIGEDVIVKKVMGAQEVKNHLENLGFTAGSNVKIVSSLSGNLIVNVKETRVALNEELARRIMI